MGLRPGDPDILLDALKIKEAERVKVSQFIKREQYHFQAFCNFTPDEERLFVLLQDGKLSLEQCGEKMNVSTATVKRIHKRVKAKIEAEMQHMILS